MTPGENRGRRRETARTNAVSWRRYEDQGAEYAELSLGARRLSALSTAIGSKPVPYRMDLRLQTAEDFMTSRLEIATRGLGWTREIDLRRGEGGVWSAELACTGSVDLPEPGGDLPSSREPLIRTSSCADLRSLPRRVTACSRGGTAPELATVRVELP